MNDGQVFGRQYEFASGMMKDFANNILNYHTYPGGTKKYIYIHEFTDHSICDFPQKLSTGDRILWKA